MMNLFLSLKRAVRLGDAITIEKIYNLFLPFFHAAGKSHFVEIVLNATDQQRIIKAKIALAAL